MIIIETYLMHYGVGHDKGGHSGRYPWGSGKKTIRGYQNKDGTLTAKGAERIAKIVAPQDKETLGKNSAKAILIPKGSTLYRMTANENESEKGSKYVTYYQGDRDFYRSKGAAWIANTNGVACDDLYEKTYTTKENLKIPPRKEVLEVYHSVLKDNKAMVKIGKEFIKQNMLTNLRQPDGSKIPEDYLDKMIKGYDKMEKKRESEDYVPTSLTEKKQLWFNISVNAKMDELKYDRDNKSDKNYLMFSGTYGVSDYTKNKMITELKKRGYNAMTDDYGVGGHDGYIRETRQALIVFDGGKSLDAKKTNTERLTFETYNKALSNYDKYSKTTLQDLLDMSNKDQWDKSYAKKFFKGKTRERYY